MQTAARALRLVPRIEPDPNAFEVEPLDDPEGPRGVVTFDLDDEKHLYKSAADRGLVTPVWLRLRRLRGGLHARIHLGARPGRPSPMF